MHGYYIEVTRAQADKVPADYIRRQTLKGVERYITPELKAFEDKVLSAEERALARERRLYDALLDKLIEQLGQSAEDRYGTGEHWMCSPIWRSVPLPCRSPRRNSPTHRSYYIEARPASGGGTGHRYTLRAQ